MLTLKWVKAAIDCEGCGKPFEVFLDPGDLDEGMDLHDLAHEAVINGNKVADIDAQTDGGMFTSIQGDFVLCPKCTHKAFDIETPNDREPTREEVARALGYPLL